MMLVATACLDVSHATITDQRSQDRQQCYKFCHITYVEVHAACPEVSHYVPTSTCMMLSNSPSPCRPENSEGGTDLRMSSALNGVNFQLGRKSSNSWPRSMSPSSPREPEESLEPNPGNDDDDDEEEDDDDEEEDEDEADE